MKNTIHFIKVNRVLLAASLLSVALLSGCAQSYRGDEYNFAQLGQSQQIYTVQILSVQAVKVDNNTGTNGDAAAGGVAGGVAGNLIGGNSAGTMIGAAAGALIGGLAGSANKDDGVLIKYKDYDGATKVVVQMGETKDFKVGAANETIFINQKQQQQVRIMPNNTQKTA